MRGVSVSKGKWCKVEKASDKPTTWDITWLAGFLEGEGYFGRNRTTHEVSITQKQKWPLEICQRYIGGALLRTYKQGCKKRSYWRLRVSGPRARGLMMTVYQFMSPVRQASIRKALDVF